MQIAKKPPVPERLCRIVRAAPCCAVELCSAYCATLLRAHILYVGRSLAVGKSIEARQPS